MDVKQKRRWKVLNEFVKEIASITKQNRTKPYDTVAKVLRVDEKTAYVHIEGGAEETPAQMAINCKEGDSVKIRVSGGRAWLTGNITAPPTDDSVAIKARELADLARGDIKAIISVVDEQGNVIVQLNNNIIQQNNTIVQLDNTIKQQGNTITEINNKVNSQGNDITLINNKLEASDSTVKIVNSSFEITNGVVTGIKGVETDWIKTKDLEANNADIKNLKANKADIDLANVNNAWIENGVIKNGSIGEGTIQNGSITNAKIADATIESAKIKSIDADTITAGTIRTDRLIITGPDGQDSIVKAINVANGVSEAEVNSQKIQAASIDVVDLSAFKAKIANFDISGNAIYSGKKTMEDPVSGIYVSTTGIGAGDGSLTGKNVTPMQLLPDGSFKLTGKNALFDFNTVTGELSIDATHFTVASKVVATKDDISSQIGARNLIRNSNTLDFEDYVFEGQVTISDLVDANGQSLVDSDGNTIKIKAAYTSIYTGKQIDDMVAEVMN